MSLEAGTAPTGSESTASTSDASATTSADTGTSTAAADSGSPSRGESSASSSRSPARSDSEVDQYFGAQPKTPADKRANRSRAKADLAAKASGKDAKNTPEKPAATIATSDASTDVAAQNTASPEADQTIESTDDNADSGDFDAETLQLAKFHGMSEEDVAAYDPAALGRFLAFLDRRDMARNKKPEPTATAEGSTKTPETEAKAETKVEAKADAASATDAAKAEFALDKYALALNPDDPLDPETVAQFTKLSDHYHGQLEKVLAHFGGKFKELSGTHETSGQKLAALENWYTQTETARLNNEYDAAFAALPEHYQSEFGEGSLSDLASDSKELAARKAIAAEARDLLALDERAGRKPMSTAQLIKRVLAARDFDKQYEQGRDSAAEHMGQRRRMGLNRPTQRRSEASTPEQRAKARMARNGVPAGSRGSELDTYFG